MNSELILDVLGNPTRRKILVGLSEEPMYFNQLARQIGVGQQAILRHLETLERGGLIDSYSERSDLGAPNRKYYRLDTSFILTVTLSKDDFSISGQKMKEYRHKESRKYYKQFDLTPERTGPALSYMQENLADVEEEISRLEAGLSDLRALKQLILHRLHGMGRDAFEKNERKVLYKIVEKSPRSISELSDIMDRKESDIRASVARMTSSLDEDSARILFEDLK